MAITLTTTWNPRGEMTRLTKLMPELRRAYQAIVTTLPPTGSQGLINELEKLGIQAIQNPDWSYGRYLSLQKALETPVDHIHYADMDRLLRWVETQPAEWLQALEALQNADCIVFGRSQAAYQTHPQSLVQTEQISNQVTSYLLGREMDVSAGSKGFSRSAAQFIVENTLPLRAIGTDAEWLVLLQRAGFHIQYMEVNGLDWESADRYKEQAADEQAQRQAAIEYDADPAHWARRVEIALEIVQSGLEAQQRQIQLDQSIQAEKGLDFDYEAVFEVEDYLYFYQDSLTPERTETEVAALVKLLQLGSPLKVLDLACGFGRHTNCLAKLGHQMTGIDRGAGFLEIARKQAQSMQVGVDYQQGDMRSLDYKDEFDGVLLLFTSFGYFNDDENLQVLRNIAQALKPGGWVIFDTHNRDVFLKNMQPDHVTEKEGNLMIDRGSFDSQSGRWYNQRIVIRDGIRRDKPFFVRLYNPNEIRALLEQAGLELSQLYGGWDGQPISTESRRMIIIGRKVAV